MSTLEAQSNFDDENRLGLRARTKQNDVQIQPKRPVLGTITNHVRRQPHRAAKQTLSSHNVGQDDENAFSKITGKSLSAQPSLPFTIHVDESPVETQKSSIDVPNKEVLQLHPAVANLPGLNLAAFQPSCALSESHLDHSNSDSPMVLDESVILVDMESAAVTEAKSSKLQDVFSASEYAKDIYAYMRSAELRNRPKPSYMKKQPDITNSMRSILVDWLIEVAEEYKLHRETLHLAVNYIDRFLSQMSVLRGKLQLVGAASMFLAAKFEEIYPPDVGEFVYITDDTYTKKQVLRMEHLILKVLSFEVAVPTINCFCDWFIQQLDADDKTSSMAMYFSDLTLVDSEPYLKYLPSVISAASVCLANWCLNDKPWDSELERITGYTFAEIEPCFKDLYKTASNAPNHPQQAAREKYRASKYHDVSSITLPQMPFQ